MWKSKSYQCLLLLIIYLCFSDGRDIKLNRYSRADVSSPSTYTYKTEWITMKVDHFNFVNFDKFELRYLINDDYWDPQSGAPIFFYTGNEADIEVFANSTGFIWETAPEFKALIVFAEHRYYGKSLPFGKKSFDTRFTYGYLTVEQALADFVDLIEYIRHKQLKMYPNSKRSPVIAIGGSYAGELSAFLRMKYPTTVIGALASSAPLHSYVGLCDCNSFNHYLTLVYHNTSSNCPVNVQKIWGEIRNLTKTETGRALLSSKWSLCKPLKHKSDGVELKYWLEDIIVDIAMANYPYPANFMGNLPGNPVKAFCDSLSSENLEGEELLDAVFNGLNSLLNYTETTQCFSWPDYLADVLGEEAWDIQSCLELVDPQCSKGGEYDLFEPSPWKLNEYESDCKYYYGVKPKIHFINEFGGSHLGYARNIIFSNGLLDPWSPRGILTDLNPTVVAVVMEGAAHHLDLRASNPLDPESVVNARIYYKKVFNQWIAEFRTFYP